MWTRMDWDLMLAKSDALTSDPSRTTMLEPQFLLQLATWASCNKSCGPSITLKKCNFPLIKKILIYIQVVI